MRHLGKFVILLLTAVNLLFTALLLLAAYSPYINPQEHPYLSCFGLTFPIFILLNLLFLFFWLLAGRYKPLLLPLLGLLLCYPQIKGYLPINSHTGQLPDEAIKVLSYNVMAFDGTEKKDGKNPILEYLKESGADIICLQEYAVSKKKGYLTQKDVDKALKAYPYHRINVVGHSKGHSNRMACYSKFPILSARMVDYNSEYNGSMVYEIKWGKDTLTLVNNHLESNKLTQADKKVYEEMLKSPEREKMKSGARLLIGKLAEATTLRAPQAEAVAEEIKRSEHATVIVCGDFNDIPLSYTHRTIAEGMNDAFTESGRGLGISYNQNKFYFRIDNILTSKNLKTYNCTVDRTIRDSDHYPIWCYVAPRE